MGRWEVSRIHPDTQLPNPYLTQHGESREAIIHIDVQPVPTKTAALAFGKQLAPTKTLPAVQWSRYSEPCTLDTYLVDNGETQ